MHMRYAILFVVVFVLILLVVILQEIRFRKIKEHLNELYLGGYTLFEAHPKIHKEFFGEYPE